MSILLIVAIGVLGAIIYLEISIKKEETNRKNEIEFNRMASKYLEERVEFMEQNLKKEQAELHNMVNGFLELNTQLIQENNKLKNKDTYTESQTEIDLCSSKKQTKGE